MKYAVAAAKDSEYWNGHFDCVEEALVKGSAELGFDGTESEIFVAEAHPFQPYIHVDNVLEQLEDDCAAECGEAADLFTPTGATETALGELECSLNAVLTAWLDKHGETATCYSVANPKRYELKPHAGNV